MTGWAETREVACPYCGEPVETLLDSPRDGLRYVEDCAVCCRPIEFRVALGPGGDLRVEALRDDE